MKFRFPLPAMAGAIMVALGFARPASAHAFLDHAEPKVGATVDKPPAEVRVWLTQDLEPAFSKLQVYAADGKEIDKKDSHLDPKDRRQLVVTVPQPLAPGTYKVVWRVVSIDTHHTHGDFKFVVK